MILYGRALSSAKALERGALLFLTNNVSCYLCIVIVLL